MEKQKQTVGDIKLNETNMELLKERYGTPHFEIDHSDIQDVIDSVYSIDNRIKVNL